jgi:hypothetical protein
MGCLILSRRSPPILSSYRGRGNRGKGNGYPVSGSFGNRGKVLKALQRMESFPEISETALPLTGGVFPKSFPFYAFDMGCFSGVFREGFQ